MTYLPEETIPYKTYIKRALVEGVRDVFAHHVDQTLSHSHVGIDFPRTEAQYPAIIVRFFEKSVSNGGLAHHELIELNNPDGTPAGRFKFEHSLYKGDIEFAVQALSSLDRDLISDTIVQMIRHGRLSEYTNRFFNRVYTDDEGRYPDSVWHTIYPNTDNISGFGEQQQPTPWGSEDDLVYQTSYRVQVMGDFYSLPPNLPVGFIQQVLVYPYIGGIEPLPKGNPDDATEWQP